MPSLIWVFAGRTCHFVGFVMRRLICLSLYKTGTAAVAPSNKFIQGYTLLIYLLLTVVTTLSLWQYISLSMAGLHYIRESMQRFIATLFHQCSLICTRVHILSNSKRIICSEDSSRSNAKPPHILNRLYLPAHGIFWYKMRELLNYPKFNG